MRKILLIMVLIVCSFSCLACSCYDDPIISYAKESITINIGNTFTIDDKNIIIENSKSSYKVIVLDEQIATIKNNIITPVNRGETKVKIYLEDDESYYVEIPLVITNHIYATNATLDSEYVQINIHKNNTAINKLTLNKGCNEVPQITYDESIISYNFRTGSIVAKTTGRTTVVILFGSVNVSFEVVVVDVVYTQKIEVEDITVFEGGQGKLPVRVFPDTANTYEFYPITNEIIKVEKDGSFQALSVGKSTVSLKYLQSENSEIKHISFVVNVVEFNDDITVDIVNVDNSDVQYFLKENKYKMIVSAYHDIKTESFVFSDNIWVENISVNNNVAEIEFYFKESGNVTFDVKVKFDEFSYINKDVTIRVLDYDDISVYAKWSIYQQSVFDDGMYRIYLHGDDGFANYLNFSLVIGDDENSVSLIEDYKIYQLVEGGRIVCLDTSIDGEKVYKFEPISVGEYCLEFAVGEEVVERAIILVLDR